MSISLSFTRAGLLRGVSAAGVLLAWLLGAAPSVFAQEPITKLEFADLKKDTFAIQALLKDRVPVPPREEPKFDAYFQKYLLSAVADPRRADLPATRAEIRKAFRIAESGAPYDRVNNMAIDVMNFIIEKWQPRNAREKRAVEAAKYNAVLVLGDLNESEGAGRLPKPLPAALDVLIKIAKNPQYPDYLRVGALLGGIQRNASLNSTHPLPADAKEEISKLAYEQLQQKKCPESRTPQAHAWVRRSAVEILAAIGDPGPNGAYVNAIVDMLNDPAVPTMSRMSLVSLLGQFKYPAKSNLNFRAAAEASCYLAVDIANRELNRVKQLNMNQQLQQIVDPSRDLLQYVFRQVEFALKGMRGGTGGLVTASQGTPHAAAVAAITARVGKIMVYLDGLGANGFVEPSDFGPLVSDLEAALPKRSTAEPPAAPAK
jgi:hypothetical protein